MWHLWSALNLRPPAESSIWEAFLTPMGETGPAPLKDSSLQTASMLSSKGH